ncbi:MAG: hypothetical protein ACOYT8_03820 [Candidatus Dependentiae bacterium]
MNIFIRALLVSTSLFIKNSIAQEPIPSSTITLIAYDAEDLAQKHTAEIPIYGKFRKIACPLIDDTKQRSLYVKFFSDVLFKRIYKLHIQGRGEGRLRINADNTVQWYNEEGKEQTVEELPCFNLTALNAFIKLSEKYNTHAANASSSNKEMVVTKLGLNKLREGNNALLSYYFYVPGQDLVLACDTKVIDNIHIQKPLAKKQFEGLYNHFVYLYNYGINPYDLSKFLQPRPLDLSLLKLIQKIVQ